MSEFDEQLWYTLIDHVAVYSKHDLRVKFKDGTIIEIRE